MICIFSFFELQMMTNDSIKVENNPWEVKSIYEYYFFNCPTCMYKHNIKQDFFDHILQFHPQSSDHLRKISDGSLSDIITPWEDTVSLPNQNLLRKFFQRLTLFTFSPSL